MEHRHADIEWQHNTYWLVGQGSLNGTFLNGERIHLESVEFEVAIPEADAESSGTAVHLGEFVETLVASEDQAKAISDAAQAAKAKQDAYSAETVIDMKPQSSAVTVDFDMFGDEPDPKSGH